MLPAPDMNDRASDMPEPKNNRFPQNLICRSRISSWSCDFLPWLVFAMIAGAILLFAHHGYPVPDGDAQYYMPPMLRKAQNGSLVSDFSPDVMGFDLSGKKRLVFHGYLYPLTIGSLAWRPDYPTIEIVIGMFLVASLLLGCRLFLVLPRIASDRLKLLDVLVVVAALPAFATSLIGHSGRAETLGAPILTVCLLWMLRANENWHSVIYAVLLGLLAGTSPMGCVIACLVLCLRVFYRWEPRRALRVLCIAGALSFAVWAATFLFYPYSLTDWISGLRENAHNVIRKEQGMDTNLWYRWMTQPGATGYGTIYLLGIGFCARHGL